MRKGRVLLHICCGPCALYPIRVLKEEDIEVTGFFFNPNIHPFREFRKRIRALEEVSQIKGIEILWDKTYGLRPFLRRTVFKENVRCEECYYWRLSETVKKALEMRAEAFTSTLLYSRYQKHNLIREIAEDLSYRFKIPFLYRDFRNGWEEGQKEAISLGIYRQPYCGCIYSEQERYDKKFRKLLKKEASSNEPF